MSCTCLLSVSLLTEYLRVKLVIFRNSMVYLETVEFTMISKNYKRDNKELNSESKNFKLLLDIDPQKLREKDVLCADIIASN